MLSLQLFRKNTVHNYKKIWTTAQGSSIGYLESLGTVGIIFTHNFVNFRQTSSNLAHGVPSQLSTYYVNVNEEYIQQLINDKRHVCIEFNEQMFCLPTRGYIFGQLFVTAIYPIDSSVGVGMSPSDIKLRVIRPIIKKESILDEKELDEKEFKLGNDIGLGHYI